MEALHCLPASSSYMSSTRLPVSLSICSCCMPCEMNHSICTCVRLHRSMVSFRFGMIIILLLFLQASCPAIAGAATCGSTRPCEDGSCCSQYGFCGNTSGFCGDGCLGLCKNSTSPSSSPAVSNLSNMVSSTITDEVFEQFFYFRNESGCPAAGFYNLSTFLAVAAMYYDFGTSGGPASSKREFAAFFAAASYLTEGGCYVEDTNRSNVDCSATPEWGCAPGKKYYGRGPLQLAWNLQYGPAGKALGFDGINDPDIVATNPTLSFRASFWYWMTVQPYEQYSCHQAILTQGQGFDQVVTILNGSPLDSTSLQDWVKVYNDYCATLGVQPNDTSATPNISSVEPSASPASVTKGQSGGSMISKHGGCIGSLCSMQSKVAGLALPLAVGFLGLVVLACLIIKYWGRRRHEDKAVRLETIQGLMESPINFHYETLESATNGFTTVIGKGGFGVVYKGVLANGHTIAVKVLTESVHTEEQFVGEIETVGKLHHVNIVRLMGFCIEKSKKILVYEFVPNGSLEKHLFNNPSESGENDSRSPVLNWERRYEISLGIARGLAYIHEEGRHKIIHRDMKPHNVLLDDCFCPKISDFGLAKIINREESHVVSQLRGTPGYMAPEFWARMRGPLSTKFDVYSYGVMMLELVAGRLHLKEDLSTEQALLPEWAYAHFTAPTLIIDPCIAHQANLRQVEVLILVALWCIQDNPASRPSMRRVVQYLEGSVDVPSLPPQPKKPIPSSTDASASTLCSGAGSCSENSIIQGR